MPINECFRQRPGDQPLPTEGQEDVQAAVIREIEDRRALGISRYGRPLQTFNGRNAFQDAREEALDLVMYLKQAELEQAALKARIDQALRLHHVPEGEDRCVSCEQVGPCETRQALLGSQKPSGPLYISQVDPVEEIACSPDAIEDIRQRFQIEPLRVAINPGPGIGEYMGLPVYVDDELPPRTVRMRPATPKQ
jgi:hypothetical protein